MKNYIVYIAYVLVGVLLAFVFFRYLFSFLELEIHIIDSFVMAILYTTIHIALGFAVKSIKE